LCNADKIVVKTRSEAFGIPDKTHNAEAIKMSRYAVSITNSVDLKNEAILTESAQISEAADYLISSILNIHNGPLWSKVYRAVKMGLIDVPFSPHQENANRLWCLRDKNSNIRIADNGKVPLPESFLVYEKKSLGSTGQDLSLDRMINEILIMSRK